MPSKPEADNVEKKMDELNKLKDEVANPGKAAKTDFKSRKMLAEHTVEEGETLSHLSLKYYSRTTEEYWRVIYEANKGQIRNPHWIYPGQIFTTPGVNPPREIDPKRREPLADSQNAAQ